MYIGHNTQAPHRAYGHSYVHLQSLCLPCFEFEYLQHTPCCEQKLESRQSDLQDVLCSKDPDRSTDIQDGESAGSGSEIVRISLCLNVSGFLGTSFLGVLDHGLAAPPFQVKNVPEKSTAIRIGHHIQFPEVSDPLEEYPFGSK